VDNVEGMKQLDEKSIDLTVTSPPYDNLRVYKGFSWDFEGVARQLFRVTKDGGVVVWVVGDATINGTETGTSFKQALYFKEVGFNLHDTMIYQKEFCPFPANVRYNQQFEFMFVFSKGKVKTFNPLKESKSEKEVEKILKGQIKVGSKSYRNKNGTTDRADSDDRMLKRLEKSVQSTEKTMGNVWKINAGYMVGSKDKIAFDHPATFPEELAEKHILSWSNEGDIVLDPFMGSGTTAKMAKLNNRNYIGFDISQEYCDIAEKRLENIQKKEFYEENNNGNF
jgi:site-specific DNA-methyltransferase (adenine-specific)